MPAWINQYRLGFSNQTMTEKQKVVIEKKYGFEWVKSKVPFRFFRKLLPLQLETLTKIKSQTWTQKDKFEKILQLKLTI